MSFSNYRMCMRFDIRFASVILHQKLKKHTHCFREAVKNYLADFVR